MKPEEELAARFARAGFSAAQQSLADIALDWFRAYLAQPEVAERAAAARYAVIDETTPDVSLRMLLAGKGTEHEGDCGQAKVVYAATCMRCLYDSEMRELGAALASILKDTP